MVHLINKNKVTTKNKRYNFCCNFIFVVDVSNKTSKSDLARVKEKSWFSQSTWMMSLNLPIFMITIKKCKHIKSTSYILTCRYFSFNELFYCCINQQPMYSRNIRFLNDHLVISFLITSTNIKISTRTGTNFNTTPAPLQSRYSTNTSTNTNINTNTRKTSPALI